MGTLILFAVSMLANTLATAWILHRCQRGQTPIPSLKSGVQVHQDPDSVPVNYQKGRPIT